MFTCCYTHLTIQLEGITEASQESLRFESCIIKKNSDNKRKNKERLNERTESWEGRQFNRLRNNRKPIGLHNDKRRVGRVAAALWQDLIHLAALEPRDCLPVHPPCCLPVQPPCTDSFQSWTNRNKNMAISEVRACPQSPLLVCSRSLLSKSTDEMKGRKNSSVPEKRNGESWKQSFMSKVKLYGGRQTPCK